MVDSETIGFPNSVISSAIGYNEMEKSVVVVGGMNGELVVVNRVKQ